MRVRPMAEWRSVGPGGLVLAAALLLTGSGASAQALRTTPAFPAATKPSPGASEDATLALRSDNGTAGSAVSGDDTGGATSGGTGAAATASRSPTRGTRVSGATSGANNRAPTNLLRQRAAPPRRVGSATARIVRAETQLPAADLRLTPVVQTPVVGVPLPALLPLAGLSTPGFLLGTALRRPLPVDDAYAPLGIKLGTFTVLPALQQSIGYDTNPDQIQASRARGSTALRTDAELNFRSDWSSSELAGELRGGYSDFPDNQEASRPNGAGNVRLRLDANRDTRIDVEGRFLIDTQRAGSPDLNATLASRPLIASYGTTLGVTETFNRLRVSVSGLVDRSEFEDAQLSNGTTLIQSDRNLTQYGLRLRAAYEISPVITPFVDVLADTRVYDLRVDTTGTRRDSDGITLSGGAAFALARFLTGEVSAGLQHRTYSDPTLKDLTAPVVNAALIWSASPLTTVRLNAATGIVETSVAGSSGVLTQAATLEVQHDLLRNLSITLGAGYLASDYDRVKITEHGFSATARVDYRFNRWLTLRGSYIYQQIDSSAAGSSFKGNTWLLGLRVNP